jgi:hypothetical protein
MIDETRLLQYFEYHPVKTPKRKSAHEQINRAAYELAQAVSEHIEDSELKQKFFRDIQFMRMMANQDITIREINNVPN